MVYTRQHNTGLLAGLCFTRSNTIAQTNIFPLYEKY